MAMDAKDIERLIKARFPDASVSIRDLAEQMIAIGRKHPAYARNAAKVQIREVKSADYYGKGYEDVQTRVPWIANTQADLGWTPKAGMDAILNSVFEAYAAEVAAAGELIDPSAG